MRRQVRERETPEPSAVWQTLAITFVGFTFTAALAALTVPEGVAIGPGEIWVAAAGFLLAAGLCFAAHWDVNKGRRSRWIEVEELPSAQQKDGTHFPPA
jgi:hypothetical protein